MKSENSVSEGQLLNHTQDELREIANDILRYGKLLGASDLVTKIWEQDGSSVSVRQGSIETIMLSHDKDVAVTVYLGKKKGTASTGDFSQRAIHATVAAALDIARFTFDDEASGLPDSDLLEHFPRDLELFHPSEMSITDVADVAKRVEDAAFVANPSVTNSEGVTVASRHAQFVLASSNGFIGGYPRSQHSVYCGVIAGEAERMQGGQWMMSRTALDDLHSPESIGRQAGMRAAAKLDPRKMKTCKVPVMFEASEAIGLLGTFVSAISGGLIYRRESFLADSIGKSVFSRHIQVQEDPYILRAGGSAPFDSEGVRTLKREVVKDGEVLSYFLSTYSARKLGMLSTGSAGGAHNLSLRSTLTKADDDFSAMLRKLGTGLLISETMGQGTNLITGDYSRGAGGFWVQDGVVQYPVQEFTIASTLQEMFRGIVAVGADELVVGRMRGGSVLIEEMTVAGM